MMGVKRISEWGRQNFAARLMQTTRTPFTRYRGEEMSDSRVLSLQQIKVRYGGEVGSRG